MVKFRFVRGEVGYRLNELQCRSEVTMRKMTEFALACLSATVMLMYLSVRIARKFPYGAHFPVRVGWCSSVRSGHKSQGTTVETRLSYSISSEGAPDRMQVLRARPNLFRPARRLGPGVGPGPLSARRAPAARVP